MKKDLCEYACGIICQLSVYRRTYKTASRLTVRDGFVVPLDGYDAS